MENRILLEAINAMLEEIRDNMKKESGTGNNKFKVNSY